MMGGLEGYSNVDRPWKGLKGTGTHSATAKLLRYLSAQDRFGEAPAVSAGSVGGELPEKLFLLDVGVNQLYSC